VDTILKIQNLTKHFGSRRVVDDISLETYAGEVFGFLGPNGAGKTTVIKMVMGLLTRDNGEIYINGIDTRKRFEAAMDNVGGIVENPETYNYLTGLQNLRQYQRVRNGVTDERVNEVIRMVKLENRIKEKVKRYSLGMKQRLGIAQAIMHRPRLLILDEPTNGLDPAGIKELRDLLKDLAHKENVGVFVSSHLLSEMELMCDRVGIIANGRLMDVKSAAELSQVGYGTEIIYRFTVDDAEKAAELLQDGDGVIVSVISGNPQSISLRIADVADVNSITMKLIGGGVTLLGVNKLERSLEDAYIEITGGGGQIA
jgi:ABC-2 type transport system ATP-binding protein